MRADSCSRAVLLVAVAAALLACGPDPADREPGEDTLHEVAEPLLGSWSGDLDGMLERRQVRALVPYSRTFYFLDERGSQRGLSHAFMEAFEEFINARMETGLLRVQVVYVPVTRDRLVPWLLAGRGDVIAANLTVTEARGEALLFTTPLASGIREVLVSGPSAAPIERLEQLSGRTVFVRRASSFFESLESLNRDFAANGLPPIRFEEAPAHFEVGDVLEMVNAGAVEHAVADDYLADFWARVLPDIEVHEDVVLREGADIAFAVRPDSPGLRALLDEFLVTHRAGTLFGNVTFERFLQDTRWVLADKGGEDLTRFERMARHFQRYGEQYDLDWLLLIAQGYQESRLDQAARSPSGAIGVMQVLPATGREMDVGDITILENNIHAGVRYLRWMIDRYYADEAMTETDRLLFALASYNAGPRRVRALRNEAQGLGLDPNVWFDNVEYVAAQRIGRETVEYVGNIYKYHIAFRLIAGARDLAALPDKG
jgi:membrane-bound lytic murein transglycosylase MltF